MWVSYKVQSIFFIANNSQTPFCDLFNAPSDCAICFNRYYIIMNNLIIYTWHNEEYLASYKSYSSDLIFFSE